MSFIEIFQPGHRFVQEERDRKRNEASRPGKAADPLGVDLDAGIVRLPARNPQSTPAAPATDDPESQDTEQ